LFNSCGRLCSRVLSVGSGRFSCLFTSSVSKLTYALCNTYVHPTSHAIHNLARLVLLLSLGFVRQIIHDGRAPYRDIHTIRAL
jgi:hypothetical protein